MRPKILVLILLVVPQSLRAQATPIDVYRACHSPNAASGKLRVFCHDLNVPTRPRALLSRELTNWIDSVPTAEDLKKASSAADSARRSFTTIAKNSRSFIFASESAVLVDTARASLVQVAKGVALDTTIRVDLTGLASATGTTRENLDLSKRRVEYVRAILLENGVHSHQIREPVAEGSRRAVAVLGGARTVDDEKFRRVDIQGSASENLQLGEFRATPSFASGISTTAVLNGLADFLIAEAIRTAQAAALQKSLEKLCDAKAPMRTFIETSCRAFDSANTKDYFPSIGRLRSAIRQDLSLLPVSLINSIATDTGSTVPICGLVLTARYFVGLSDGQSPRDALTATILSAGSRCGTGAANRLDWAVSSMGMYENAWSELIDIQRAGELNRDSLVNYAIKTIAVNSAADKRRPLVEKGARLLLTIEQSQAAWQSVAEDLSRARTVASQTEARRDISLLISSGASAVLELLSLVEEQPGTVRLSTSFGGTTISIAENIRLATVSLASAHYGEALSAIDAASKSAGLTHLNLTPLAFAADVAQASTADDVNSALQRYAKVTSGRTMKRNGAGYFTVNAYAGISAGAERASKKLAAFSSLYLPVGIEGGWGIRPNAAKKPRVNSFGFFAQVIDLGSLASVRLANDDEIEETPSTNLASVWSPGLMARIGFADTPFVLSAGASYVPAARRDRAKDQLVGAVRALVSLSIDIPLYGLSKHR